MATQGMTWENSMGNSGCEFLELAQRAESTLLFSTGVVPWVTAGLGQLESIFLPGKRGFAELVSSENGGADQRSTFNSIRKRDLWKAKLRKQYLGFKFPEDITVSTTEHVDFWSSQLILQVIQEN
ncbi:hypothetical protein AV530_004829 [Patagioenas fasciata monilis]|uniref:Uncharacterized protein n=1 Tax=Patagioenas fasciata monilis TaxID=372326 RepID=A0A1V4KFR8_PATFA|nr:hypothetical protein AV530_004829 [Patagioenas fasciata monilis]